MSRKTNQAGVDLIKSFEGKKLESYLCPARIWTIGYGHTGEEVKKGLVITEEEAEELLKQDLEHFERGVCQLVKVPVNDNQFAALVSFSFNLGLANLKISTLLRCLNSYHYEDAAQEFLKWNKANGRTLEGLVIRREAEKALFLKA